MGTRLPFYNIGSLDDKNAIWEYTGNTDSCKILSTNKKTGLSRIKLIKNKYVEEYDENDELVCYHKDVIATGYLNKNDAKRQVIKNINDHIKALKKEIKNIEKDILTSEKPA